MKQFEKSFLSRICKILDSNNKLTEQFNSYSLMDGRKGGREREREREREMALTFTVSKVI